MIFLATAAFANQCYAQSDRNEFVEKYKEILNAEAELIEFTYQSAVERIDDKYVLKYFNPDKFQLTIFKTFSDRKLKKLDGEFKEWYDNGRLWKKGQFVKNKPEGKWVEYPFDEKGFTHTGFYEDGHKEGVWKSFDNKGRVIVTQSYSEGKLNGSYVHFDTLGRAIIEKVFENGEEIESQVLDSLQFSKVDFKENKLPVMKECKDKTGEDFEKCRKDALIRFVFSNIRYPHAARDRGIAGTVLLRFLVTKDGKIGKIDVLRGVCDALEKETIRVIRSVPGFAPGMNNGEAVEVQYYLPVKFRLQ